MDGVRSTDSRIAWNEAPENLICAIQRVTHTGGLKQIHWKLKIWVIYWTKKWREKTKKLAGGLPPQRFQCLWKHWVINFRWRSCEYISFLVFLFWTIEVVLLFSFQNQFLNFRVTVINFWCWLQMLDDPHLNQLFAIKFLCTLFGFGETLEPTQQKMKWVVFVLELSIAVHIVHLFADSGYICWEISFFRWT